MASPLVEPIVPTPDISGVTKGLMLYAEGRKNAQLHELAQQKLIQDAANDNAMMEYRREALANQFAVQQSQISLNKAHEDYYKNYLGPLRNTAANQIIENNKQLVNVTADAMQRYKEYKLDDNKFLLDDPISYSANYLKFKDEYDNTKAITGLKPVYDLVVNTGRKVDQLQVPLRRGAVWQETQAATDKEPAKGKWVGGLTEKVPAYQIVQNLQNPDLADRMMNDLAASGHTKSVATAPTEVTGPRRIGSDKPYLGINVGTKTYQVPTTVTTPDDIIAPWLKKATQTGVRFDPGMNRVPLMMAPTSGAYRGTGEMRNALQQELDQADQEAQLPAEDQSNLYPTAAPASVTPAAFGPTQTDQILNQARAALQAGAPLQMVAQRLAAQQIDPRMLFQQQALQGATQSPRAPGDTFNSAIA